MPEWILSHPARLEGCRSPPAAPQGLRAPVPIPWRLLRARAERPAPPARTVRQAPAVAQQALGPAAAVPRAPPRYPRWNPPPRLAQSTIEEAAQAQRLEAERTPVGRSPAVSVRSRSSGLADHRRSDRSARWVASPPPAPRTAR